MKKDKNNQNTELILDEIDNYISDICAVDPFPDRSRLVTIINNYFYFHFSNNYNLRNCLKRYQSELLRNSTIDYIHEVNKYFLYLLYKLNINHVDDKYLPTEVKGYILEDFGNVIRIIKDNKKFDYSYGNYIYFSYSRVLLFNRLPVGVVNLDVDLFCRSVLFRQTLKGGIDFIKCYITSRGSRPYFQLHYNPHRFRKFTPDGWREAISLTDDLLKIMPQVKGVCGAAWFFDPILKLVSPELCYLRELFESVGGKFFYNGCSDEDREDAFAMSKKRKDAFEAGIYEPVNYLMILPRKTLFDNVSRLNL